jgi:hypothetical protein
MTFVHRSHLTSHIAQDGHEVYGTTTPRIKITNQKLVLVFGVTFWQSYQLQSNGPTWSGYRLPCKAVPKFEIVCHKASHWGLPEGFPLGLGAEGRAIVLASTGKSPSSSSPGNLRGLLAGELACEDGRDVLPRDLYGSGGRADVAEL